MNRFSKLLCCVAIVGPIMLSSHAPAHADTVIGFWDFNDGYVEADESPQIIHTASQGSGILYQQRADTDGNGKDGVVFTDAALGINAADGQAMAWDDVAKSGDNDAEWFVEFSTLGFQTIQVRFDIRGNGDPVEEIMSYDLKYDTNALVDVTNPGDVVGTIKDFAGGLSTDLLNNQTLALVDGSFVTQTIDLSAVTALNNQTTVALRFDDFSRNDANGAMRIDNFMITGVTAIPEPGSAGLLGLIGGACVICQRRRK
ncbi:PEP-CTERM sorting domain-containing protein [Stieleria sp. TO1_6]|uniref:PEP-CTERM sorting domain-containing protein n=1 Tax=Stieleria tagensis TaxID=2956795 RepID=UPI00209A6BF4|nr:PEP-CTERM sorting domain-containing protein [Stieleria tagensis]MCO8124653.1 PEP-CTERM sorting domain-containing protein [Stieleria tagensis]